MHFMSKAQLCRWTAIPRVVNDSEGLFQICSSTPFQDSGSSNHFPQQNVLRDWLQCNEQGAHDVVL